MTDKVWPKGNNVKKEKDKTKMVKTGKGKPLIETVENPELNVKEIRDKISKSKVVTPDLVRQLKNNLVRT